MSTLIDAPVARKLTEEGKAIRKAKEAKERERWLDTPEGKEIMSDVVTQIEKAVLEGSYHANMRLPGRDGITGHITNLLRMRGYSVNVSYLVNPRNYVDVRIQWMYER